MYDDVIIDEATKLIIFGSSRLFIYMNIVNIEAILANSGYPL